MVSSFCAKHKSNLLIINLEKYLTDFHLLNDFFVNLAFNKISGIFFYLISKIIFGQNSDSMNIAKSGFQNLIKFFERKFVSIGKN